MMDLEQGFFALTESAIDDHYQCIDKFNEENMANHILFTAEEFEKSEDGNQLYVKYHTIMCCGKERLDTIRGILTRIDDFPKGLEPVIKSNVIIMHEFMHDLIMVTERFMYKKLSNIPDTSSSSSNEDDSSSSD